MNRRDFMKTTAGAAAALVAAPFLPATAGLERSLACDGFNRAGPEWRNVFRQSEGTILCSTRFQPAINLKAGDTIKVSYTLTQD